MQAIGARVQQVASRGDRVAILAPQGLDYVAGFFAAVKAGTIAVPLFAPELQGHAERLETALADARPTAIMTTAAAADAVRAFLANLAFARTMPVITIDDVPDSAADAFVPVDLDVDDVSHLQYTSGSTRPPVGVEITHRAVGINLLQMILSIDLLDRNTHGVSWLPLYHDMGLSMIGFPAVYGGHSTLMSPTAFIRRPQRWIRALSDGSRQGRVVTAAPNFAYEYTAQRGLPAPGEDVDLSNVVMIIGSEPVSMDAITTFNAAFAPYGLPPTAIKPSYGIAEATLFVSTIAPAARATVAYFDREPACRRSGGARRGGRRERSRTRVMRSGRPQPVGRHRRPGRATELADGQVGEIWLRGDNTARRYWSRPEESRQTFDATLRSRLGREATPTAHRSMRRGCAPGISGSTSTASCTSQAGVPTCACRRPASLPTGHRGHHGGRLADRAPGLRRGFATDDGVVDRRRARVGHPPRRSAGRGRQRSARRSSMSTGSPSPTSASYRPAPFRARRAARWPVGRAKPSICAANCGGSRRSVLAAAHFGG